MSLSVRTAGAVAFVWILLAGQAAAADARLAEVFDAIAFRKSVETMPQDIVTGLSSVPEAEMGDVRSEDLRELAERFFNGQVLARDIMSRMSGRLTDAQLVDVLRFYRSDLGKKLVAMEVAVASEEESGRMDREGPELFRQLQQENPGRVALFDRIKASIRYEDMLTAMMMNMSYALISGMAGSSLMPQQLSDDQIIEMVNAQAMAMREEIAPMVDAYFAYMYREATNDDLSRYADYSESDSGRAFNKVLLTAFQGALVDRMRGFGHELMVLRGVRRI